MKNTTLKPIDMPVFSYWSALYHAFYSRHLYVDVGKRWRGFGFLYLMLAVAILSGPFVLRVANVFKHDFSQQILEPLLQMPTLYVQNGDISIDKPLPYLIKNKQGQVVLLINTTDKINQFDSQYPYLKILISKNSIAFRMPGLQLFHQEEIPLNTSKPVVQILDKSMNSVFDGKKFIESTSITAIVLGMQLLLYPLVVTVLCSILFVIFPTMAFMGQIISSVFFSFTMRYMQACRLLIVCSTPMILFLMMFLFLDKMFMGMGVILFALLIAYYFFAIFSFKAESQQVVKS